MALLDSYFFFPYYVQSLRAVIVEFLVTLDSGFLFDKLVFEFSGVWMLCGCCKIFIKSFQLFDQVPQIYKAKVSDLYVICFVWKKFCNELMNNDLQKFVTFVFKAWLDTCPKVRYKLMCSILWRRKTSVHVSLCISVRVSLCISVQSCRPQILFPEVSFPFQCWQDLVHLLETRSYGLRGRLANNNFNKTLLCTLFTRLSLGSEINSEWMRWSFWLLMWLSLCIAVCGCIHLTSPSRVSASLGIKRQAVSILNNQTSRVND